MDKRTFLKTAGMIGIGGMISMEGLARLFESVSEISPSALAEDEDFWATIRQGYKLKPDFINLENGYYNFVPTQTMEKFFDHFREVNYHGSYYMRNHREDDNKAMVTRLAKLAGCSTEELVITRNTTESLDLVIGGFDWEEGDEAVFAIQDYGAMRDMFKLVSKRYGVVNKEISIPNHPKSDEEIVDLYAAAITDKTKLIMVSHMINITGQILPVRKICDMAHERGVDVIVDGAHTFGHFTFEIPDLHCDYFGSSLHKWLSVPLGAGLLYVKKDKISKVWPLMGAGNKDRDDIARLNHIGTYPAHTVLAIADAIDFYNMMGGERKEARLRYIQNYWTSRVRDLPHISLNTPADPARSCGIANVGIKNMKPSDLADKLFKNYNIYTAAIDGAGVHGCRVTPNVYTSTAELDVLVKALKELKS